MIRDANPILQAFLGTLMTWGITALGASFVFVTKKRNRKLLDVCLGFAAGVMTAASFWSLLNPGIERAVESGIYGAEGQYAFGPAAIGFLLGALFVAAADFGMKKLTKTRKKSEDAGCLQFLQRKHNKTMGLDAGSATAGNVEAAANNAGFEQEAAGGTELTQNELHAGRADSW